MGTNYYWITGKCESCGRTNEPLHIGKSSAGWAFALRIYPDKQIKTLYDWIRLWARSDGYIEDEYHSPIGLREMLQTITCRDREIARHAMEAKPGEGTWDYCDYEFS